jgi:hypothetical protein
MIKRSLKLARPRQGVAMLTRTVFLESVDRHERLFLKTPPARVGQFSERVPMIKGRLDRRASTATGYAWLVWEKDKNGGTFGYRRKALSGTMTTPLLPAFRQAKAACGTIREVGLIGPPTTIARRGSKRSHPLCHLR